MARGQSEDDYPGLIDFGRDIGLDMIDIFMMSEMQTPEFLLRTKLMCVDAGLPIGYFASGVSLVGPEDMRAQRLARAKADADSAAFIGAQVPPRVRPTHLAGHRRGAGEVLGADDRGLPGSLPTIAPSVE